MPISVVPQFNPSQFFQPPASALQGTQRLDTKVSAISASSDLTGRLSVVTAEGDKITLSADLEARYQAVNYQGHAESNGKAVDVSAHSTALSLSQQYGVTVEGDLNEQEVQDLEKLFRNVSSIFQKFSNGQDEAALAKTAGLAAQFGQASSLSSLDLSVDVERTVTALSAQVASAATGSAPGSTATPGGAPATAAVIPQSSTGTTAPTPPLNSTATPSSDNSSHLAAKPADNDPTKSLVQQVLDALQETRLESDKVRAHLSNFLKKLQEKVAKELRGEQGPTAQEQDAPASQPQPPTKTNSSVVFAYQSVQQAALSFSIRT